MKRVITFFLVLALVLSLCAMPTFAATSKEDWKKQTGPAKIELTEEGLKCVYEEGLSFFKYTKEMIDIKNFKGKFIFHNSDTPGKIYTMTLTASKSYTGVGSTGLFLLFRVPREGVVNVEGQILHMDYYLTEPTRNKDIAVDTTKPIVVTGTDNGDGTYTVGFEGATDSYTFEIPENYQFTEDANGQGYFSVGGIIDENYEGAMTVVSINGIDFSGNKPEPESSSVPTTSQDVIIGGNGEDVIIGAENNEENTEEQVEETSPNLTLVIVICGVIILGVAAAITILVIKKKSATKEKTEE